MNFLHVNEALPLIAPVLFYGTPGMNKGKQKGKDNNNYRGGTSSAYYRDVAKKQSPKGSRVCSKCGRSGTSSGRGATIVAAHLDGGKGGTKRVKWQCRSCNKKGPLNKLPKSGRKKGSASRAKV